MIGWLTHGNGNLVGYQHRYVFAQTFCPCKFQNLMAFGSKANAEWWRRQGGNGCENIWIFRQFDNRGLITVFLQFLVAAVFDFIVCNGCNGNKDILFMDMAVNCLIHGFCADSLFGMSQACWQGRLNLTVNQRDFRSGSTARAR